MLQAVRGNASDKHIDVEKDSALVRFRADGILYIKDSYSVEDGSKIVNEVKAVAGITSINEIRRVFWI